MHKCMCDCMTAHISTVVEFSPTKGEPTMVWRRWQHYDWLYVHTRTHIFLRDCTCFDGGRFLSITWQTHYRSAVTHMCVFLHDCTHPQTDHYASIEGNGTVIGRTHTHTCVTARLHISTGVDFCPTNGNSLLVLRRDDTVTGCMCTHVCVPAHISTAVDFYSPLWRLTTGLQKGTILVVCADAHRYVWLCYLHMFQQGQISVQQKGNSLRVCRSQWHLD